MADGIKIEITRNAFEKYYDGILKRSQDGGAGLARIAYPLYQNAQRKRWMTENASEGDTWTPLTAAYAARKLTKFAGYPGGGSKMLIATGDLVGSVTGDDLTYHKRVIENGSMFISTTIAYAKYVNEKRPFFEFSEPTKSEIRKALFKYYIKGEG